MARIIRTTRDHYWLEEDLQIEDSSPYQKTITVTSDRRYQKHLGIGGAFTEAASEAFRILDSQSQKELLESLFGRAGLRYNLGRIPVHSCDFSTNSYTYIPDGAEDLNNFDTSRECHRFELIKRAIALQGDLLLMISPWSPPGYMKDNGSMVGGGRLLPQYRKLWAQYLVKFIAEVEKNDIPVAYMTVQNEPAAIQTWESCLYSATEEGLFLRDYLYPELLKNNKGHVKVFIWDHNRDLLVDRAKETLAIPGLEEIVWGIAYHWYCSTAYENLKRVHDSFPDKHLLLSECCVELAFDTSTQKTVKPGLYEHGERYAEHMIHDFNNFSEGYIDWNLCLDERGGPNHVGNFCESPIMIDRKTKAINFLPSYYFIGHFSKYISRGSFRLHSEVSHDSLQSVAYQNPEGKTVVVILNNTEDDFSLKVSIDDNNYSLMMSAHSIVTLIE